MKTDQFILETTMTERDRLWEEIEEVFGSIGATEIDGFLEEMKGRGVDDTEAFRAEATTFKDGSMPQAKWWEETFETYYYDIEYIYFADRWIRTQEEKK